MDRDEMIKGILAGNAARMDLSGANLRGADLRGANLCEADLSRADLRGAKGLPSVVVPDLDRRVCGETTVKLALDMAHWHSCKTTHCRGGWAITLAGVAGAALEKNLGSCAAAALIYAASRPGMRVPDFYADDEDALASIREDAAGVPVP